MRNEAEDQVGMTISNVPVHEIGGCILQPFGVFHNSDDHDHKSRNERKLNLAQSMGYENSRQLFKLLTN